MTTSPTAPALPAGAERAPSIFSPLADSGYRRLLISTALWWSARWMETVVLGWLVLQWTNSAWSVALVGFFRVAPMPVLGLLGGAIADRYERRRLVVVAQCLNFTVTLVMVACLFTDRLSLPIVYAATFMMGVGWSIDWPARRSLMMDLVGFRLLHRATVLDTGVLFGMKIVGPVLGGALFTPFGPLGCFIILAGIYFVEIVLLASIRPTAAKTSKQSVGQILTNLKLGFQYVATSQVILATLAITFFMNLLGFPYQYIVPVIARDTLGVGPEQLGLLVAADALGTLLGAVGLTILGNRRPGWVYIGGSVGLGVFLLLFSLSHWYWLSLVLLLCAGVGVAGFATNQSTIILASVPEDMRGRAMGVLTACIGTLPAGVLLLGALSERAGAQIGVLVMAGLCTVLVLGTTAIAPKLRAH